MLFASHAFLLFFVVVFAFRCFAYRWKSIYGIGLLVASLLFYAWDTPLYLFLLLLLAFFTFDLGLKMETFSKGDINRHFVFFVGVVINISVLFILKYSETLIRVIESVSPDFIAQTPRTAFHYILPIGISFYALQAIFYLAEVYSGRMKAEGSYFSFLLYLSFFPKIIAGPFIRSSNFFSQLRSVSRITQDDLFSGCYAIVQGLFFKMVLAASFEREVDVYWQPGHLSFHHPLISLMTIWIFFLQIYCDFFGYTQIGRGIARLLGFRFKRAVDYPLLSLTAVNFWRRWNSSLTKVVANYFAEWVKLRRRSSLEVSAILFSLMLLYGAWHGSNTMYFLWGAWMGMLILLERRLFNLGAECRYSLTKSILWGVLFQVALIIGWFFLKTDNLNNLMYHVNNIFSNSCNVTPLRGHIWNYYFKVPIWFSIVVIAIHVRVLLQRALKFRISKTERAAAMGLMAYMILTCYGKVTDFFYFRF